MYHVTPLIQNPIKYQVFFIYMGNMLIYIYNIKIIEMNFRVSHMNDLDSLSNREK